jgi:hypothetical protein
VRLSRVGRERCYISLQKAHSQRAQPDLALRRRIAPLGSCRGAAPPILMGIDLYTEFRRRGLLKDAIADFRLWKFTLSAEDAVGWLMQRIDRGMPARLH